jgi:hypothetical protein
MSGVVVNLADVRAPCVPASAPVRRQRGRRAHVRL